MDFNLINFHNIDTVPHLISPPVTLHFTEHYNGENVISISGAKCTKLSKFKKTNKHRCTHKWSSASDIDFYLTLYNPTMMSPQPNPLFTSHSDTT